MKRAPLRTALPLIISSTLIVAAAIVACGDDSSSDVTTPDGSAPGADGSPSSPDGTILSSDDGSTPDPGDGGIEESPDGGDLPPEDDAGTTDLDGGFDAGPACQALTTGAFVKSTCAGISKIHTGGTLTTTNYHIASVTVLGSKAFCTAATGGFVAYDHRGALEVTATSATTATFEFLDQYRKSGNVIVRPTSVRYDVAVTAAAATLTYTPQPCAAKAPPTTAQFTVGSTTVDGGTKKTIVLKLPYGATGSANYTFVED